MVSRYIIIANRKWILLVLFAKLRKASIRLVMSGHPSVRMEQLGSYRTDFHEIWVFFENLWRKCDSFFKIQQEWRI